MSQFPSSSCYLISFKCFASSKDQGRFARSVQRCQIDNGSDKKNELMVYVVRGYTGRGCRPIASDLDNLG
ncbi:hypothetical protein SK128_007642 [Halocaridina rubra]|uniref:Uncharacterized protein n=1 Tax=Halocaridina rubra TaxID=373956 RepID=A0AAN8XAX2_HALRR